MRPVSSNQLTLPLEPGLLERYPRLIDCIRATVARSDKLHKTIAAEMDLSQSDLSRKLAQHPEDSRRFGVDDLETLIAASGDTTPVRYLAQKYLQDDGAKREHALETLADMLPQIAALIAQAGVGKPRK
jgi:hypothetical protein